MLEIGEILGGRYEILKRIGSGGMADVYMAKDQKLNRNVAVKVLKREYVDDEKFLKKFQIEAQAVASLTHPNIVNIYDVGAENGVNYIVMELAGGITLKEYIKKKGYLSPQETVDVSIQIASAISHAHNHHIIHRDIKPQNILISEDGMIKVTDFGIAKAANTNTVTSTATAMGSVHYISPEQAKGRFCDEKSDIYSLGITMYEMITGKVPFDHENGVTIALMHLQNDIVPPSEIKEGIPDSLEKIILKCVMKKPEERYQTAEELIEDLKLVFQDTSGDYVGFAPAVDDSPTIMVDQEELQQQLEEDEIEPEEESEEEGENGYLSEDDDEEEGMNSKIQKLIIILAAVVGAIILIAIISFVVRSSGLFRSGDKASTERITTTESVEEDTESDKYQVPNVVGMSLSQAKEAIGDNLKIETKSQASSNYRSGLVISQSLESDSEVDKGDTITLIVSSGEEKTTVPNVKGQSQSSATRTLKNAGFKVSVKTSYSSSVDEGDVISQSPSSGSKLAEGSTVTITVSSGSERVTVPSLSHYTEAEARQQLRNMGLTLGSVNRKYDDSVEKNYVISQSISSGTKVAKGTAVGITVSLGSRPSTTTDEEPEEEEPDENE
ncbi:MAG TPA: Stk1 family PASTA domain-containing Ser/Thr kinase [Candidatus Anaerostipes excrementavium]|uniref:non-specific serine/threonine protein kinase n=1 Tax=Candidatus Anaerostipes excrementavium TaxID=2838463 RepID=A0A9D1WUZ0_9FIRM|nr:Stk1 family PASTA domain-containing Ser/Thr kinase [uncultured Anaerostipes sp.]HIX66545.1 Stk1 family PASTA domain-containing Ser/Thr kinase [Candidatus Anaerostipes excrementavium]